MFKYPTLIYNNGRFIKREKFWFKDLFRKISMWSRKITFGFSTPQYYINTLEKQICVLSVAMFIHVDARKMLRRLDDIQFLLYGLNWT